MKNLTIATTQIVVVICLALTVAIVSGCGGGKQTQGVTPKSLGIGPPVLPNGKGVQKNANLTSTRPVPNNGAKN